MKIEILGTGCAKCQSLAANAQAAADGLGVDYELVKVTDIVEITSRGVLMTPALVIDGDVRSMGKVLATDEIKRLLS